MTCCLWISSENWFLSGHRLRKEGGADILVTDFGEREELTFWSRTSERGRRGTCSLMIQQILLLICLNLKPHVWKVLINEEHRCSSLYYPNVSLGSLIIQNEHCTFLNQCLIILSIRIKFFCCITKVFLKSLYFVYNLQWKLGLLKFKTKKRKKDKQGTERL